MRIAPILCGVVLLSWVASPTLADWSVGDGQNMHYPQLPDPQGWDVEVFRHELADDWQATWEIPITEIHFWTSWFDDAVGDPQMIQIRFYDDLGGLPGTLLWSRVFLSSEVTIVHPAGSGLQGFYVPEGPEWIPGNHVFYQQINIVDIVDPFTPAAGTVYWFSVEIDWTGIQAPVGWKTSLDTYRAGAVWDHWYVPGWAPLTDPTGVPLDMAFVLGPGHSIGIEPGSWAGIKSLYH